jgi:hypothetical protein
LFRHRPVKGSASWWLLTWLTVRHWRWRNYIHPKRQYTFIWLNDVRFPLWELQMQRRSVNEVLKGVQGSERDAMTSVLTSCIAVTPARLLSAIMIAVVNEGCVTQSRNKISDNIRSHGKNLLL